MSAVDPSFAETGPHARTAASDTPVGQRIVVRAGLAWIFLTLVCIGLNVFSVLAFGLHGASTGDRVGVGLVVGALAAGTLSVATTRLIFQGRTFTAITTLRILAVDGSEVKGVNDGNGLAVILRSGREVGLVVTEPSLAQLIIRNRRRRREGAAIRAWAAHWGDGDTTSWAPTSWTARIRWMPLIAVPAWMLVSTVITLGLHETFG